MVAESIISCLQNNYFLHFAGSWYESDMWKNAELKRIYFKSKILKELIKFHKTKMTGKPKGMLKPKSR